MYTDLIATIAPLPWGQLKTQVLDGQGMVVVNTPAARPLEDRKALAEFIVQAANAQNGAG